MLGGRVVRTDGRWSHKAACRGVDPAVFFPENEKDEEKVREAREICDRCIVKAPCLAESLAPPFEEFGVWGGLTAPERKKFARQIKRKATGAA